jgi:hypothetical protein
MIVNFSGLAVGTKLSNQFPDVTFVRYFSGVGGIVVDSPSGHVASFTDCPGCEFFSRGANIEFARLQHTVTLHVGLLPALGVIQRDLRLTAHDAGGVPLGTAIATVTAGAGFATALTLSLPTPLIASVVLEPVSDPGLAANIAVLDIAFVNDVSGGPDFELIAPIGGTLVQGGPPSDIPIVIRRIGGSAGGILLSVSTLPAGITGTVSPSTAPPDTVSLRLQAAVALQPTYFTLVVVGIPTTPTAGPVARTVSIELGTVPMIQIFGPANIDFAGCMQTAAAHGTVTRTYWVTRDWTVAGVFGVALEGVPAGVTSTITPSTLTFPGGVLGQQITIQLTSIAGQPVPDTWTNLHVVGPGVDKSYPVLVHGTCPQQNFNFVIRGQFSCINRRVWRPLDGVQVEIFRYRSDWYDDWVGGTFTDAQGNFSVELFASIEGQYYARVRLFNALLQLEDACNLSVWSWDTPHHSNRGGLIDVGSWTISRDGGQGSPRAAVWQGCRDAIVDLYQVTAGEPTTWRARGFLNIIVYRGTGPLTWFDEIHWKHGQDTGEDWNPYRVCFHEYGHVIRDKLDGDLWHWHADDVHYVYGRQHSACHGQDEFGIALDEKGFAFHEGWAEYWSHETPCCSMAFGNEAIEGTVAFDLQQLEALVGRAAMVRVLARGQNIIHSDSEFRRQFTYEFPTVPIDHLPFGCGGPMPLSLNMPASFDPAADGRQRESLLAAIKDRERTLRDLRAQQRTTSGMRHFVLRAAAEECTLILERLRSQLADIDAKIPPRRELQRRVTLRREMAEFRAKRRSIQLQALRDALAKVRHDQRREIERRIDLLEHPGIVDHTLDNLFHLPEPASDDAVARHRHRREAERDNDQPSRRRKRRPKVEDRRK